MELFAKLYRLDSSLVMGVFRNSAVLQMLIAIVGAGVGGLLLHRALQGNKVQHASTTLPSTLVSQEWTLPLAGDVPVRVAEIGEVGLIRREEAARILANTVPTWITPKTTVVLHGLHLWGRDVRFDRANFTSPYHSQVFDGSEMLDLLLDEELGRRLAPGQVPHLRSSPAGIQAYYGARDLGGFTGALKHPDDLLSACAVHCIPLDTPVRAHDKLGSIRDILNDSIWRFDPTQELEWTVHSYAVYLPPNRTWTNRKGQVFSFDDAARILMSKPKGSGACLGTHVPYTLIMLFRVNEQHKIITMEVELEIKRYLREVANSLEHLRDGLGCWPAKWAEGVSSPDADNPTLERVGAITATGHHLEWIAYAPVELRPSRQRLQAAIHGTLKLCEDWSHIERNEFYAPMAHLAKALCLTLTESPDSVLENYTTSKAPLTK